LSRSVLAGVVNDVIIFYLPKPHDDARLCG
jgi:hypothetical protein